MTFPFNSGQIQTFKKNVITSGKPTKLSPHIIATTIAFVNANPDTITDTGNGLLNAGFVAGDFIQVSGSTSNDGVYEISTIVAGTITLVTAEQLTVEFAGASVTIIRVFSKQLPYESGIPVHDGTRVVIKAKKANTGDITHGMSSADALNTSIKCFLLDANESVEYNVSNLSAIWIDTTSSGDGVEITFEK